MKISNNKIIGIIALFIWIFITVLRISVHQPWYDESHAYMLVQNLSVLDLIAEMRTEGHLMVWFLLMLPFAKLHLWYPYPMQIINWLFALSAVILLWKKAPFHPVTKIIIMFSYPFLAELPVIARCYAVGVFLLFCITSLYKNCLKHPILYTSLILLCANTSVMALFGATAFGLVFAYDLINGALTNIVSRKDFRISFSILALTAVLILWQIGGSVGYKITNAGTFLNHFSEFVFGSLASKILFIKIGILAIILLTVILTLTVSFIKNKKICFIYLFTFLGMLTCFLFKYSGYQQHFIFFWIYALIAVWLLFEQNVSIHKVLKNVFNIILVLFFSVFIFAQINCLFIYSSHSKDTAKKIEKIIAENSRIILIEQIDDGIVPYLENSGIEIYSYVSGLPAINCIIYTEDYPLFKAYMSENYISQNWLNNSLSDSKNNYILLPQHISTDKLTLDNKKLKFIEHLDFGIDIYMFVK